MKILLIHDFYQQFGGEDAVALAEKQLLEKHGEHVVPYTRHNDEIKEFRLRDKALFPFQAIYSWRTRREIAELARESRPDVAYIHNVFPLVSPSVYHALHSLKVPIVQVVHDFRLLCPNGWFFTKGKICERCKYGTYLHAVRYRCYRNSYVLSALYSCSMGINRLAGVMDKIDAFVCLTEFSKAKLLEVGVPEAKIFVKPNFIDASEVLPSPREGNYILYLGRLSPEKGVWTLVRAFEQLRDVELKLVGTGPLEQTLRSYVKEKGLTNIQLLGFKQGGEKWKWLSDSLMTIVPSQWYETFARVTLEAYAVSKPVIGSNLGSLPYVIEDGKTGLLFEPGNVGDLIEKIGYLLDRPAERQRMGECGRQLVETRYSPETSYRTLMSIFSQVCGPS